MFGDRPQTEAQMLKQLEPLLPQGAVTFGEKSINDLSYPTLQQLHQVIEEKRGSGHHSDHNAAEIAANQPGSQNRSFNSRIDGLLNGKLLETHDALREAQKRNKEE